MNSSESYIDPIVSYIKVTFTFTISLSDTCLHFVSLIKGLILSRFQSIHYTSLTFFLLTISFFWGTEPLNLVFGHKCVKTLCLSMNLKTTVFSVYLKLCKSLIVIEVHCPFSFVFIRVHYNV